jgi:hypothetical protein
MTTEVSSVSQMVKGHPIPFTTFAILDHRGEELPTTSKEEHLECLRVVYSVLYQEPLAKRDQGAVFFPKGKTGKVSWAQGMGYRAEEF